MKLYYLIYNILFIPIFLFLSKILAIFLPKVKERNKNITLSLENLKKINHSFPVIWFHAASMGEFEQAKPIIEKIKNTNQNIQIICTFFSPSGYNTQKKYEFADAVCYLPFDSIKNAKKFINQINPTAVVFVRYELWLNFLSQLRKQKISTMLANATYPSVLKKAAILSGFYRCLFNLFDKIYAVSKIDYDLFNNLNLKTQIIRSSDTRIDRIIAKVDEVKESNIIPKAYFNNEDVVLVAGSTWDIDENYLLYAYNKINKIYNNRLKLIIVPHEPTQAHIDNLTAKISDYILLSKLIDNLDKNINIRNRNEIIIVDSIGKLLKLYGNANIAYIGGAFGVGVHSLTEPAGYGIPLCTGTNCYNSPDCNTLYESGALTIVNTKEELFNWIENVIINNKFRYNSGLAAENYIKSSTGATNIIAIDIMKYIEL